MTFAERVYKELRNIPAGRVITYKDLAIRLGSKAYRAVGTALKNNPYAPEVPCHRVIKSDGSVGSFMGKSEGEGVVRKIVMLRNEGVEVLGGKINMKKFGMT